MKDRNKILDIAKGICIILVVFGHSFPDASNVGGIKNPFWKNVYDIIYTFHMPFFFVASGYCFFHYLDKKGLKVRLNLIKKSVKKFIVPYMFWGILFYFVQIIFDKYSNHEPSSHILLDLLKGNNPYTGMWYLYLLFIFYVFYFFFDFPYSMEIVLFCSILFKLNGNDCSHIFFVGGFLEYLVYFSIGCYLFKCQYYKKINYTYLSMIFITVLIYANVLENTIKDNFCYFMLSIIGILLVYVVSVVIFKHQEISNLFIWVGNRTMEILVLHGIIIIIIKKLLYYYLGIPYNVCLLFTFLVGVLGSIFVAEFIVKKHKVCSYFMLGK